MSRQLYFQGNQETSPRKDKGMGIPSLSDRRKFNKPQDYIFHPALIDAIDTALTLSMPLLLTGEPGSGKTQVAHSLAHELNVDVIEFEGKSDSEARDLFYHFDTIGRYHASQSKQGDVDSRKYIHYQALGLAIIRAQTENKIKPYVANDFEHGGQRRSLVLIDEIDKTPRDFPNDLLTQIEQMKFRVPEFGIAGEIAADKTYSPFIVITSNSEKSLPDAFLRRCIYYHIPFPGKAILMDIIEARLDSWLTQDHGLLNSTLDFFTEIRQGQYHWRKKPGTAELLDWLSRLKRLNIARDMDLKNNELVLQSSRSTLFKVKEDQENAENEIRKWCGKASSKVDLKDRENA